MRRELGCFPAPAKGATQCQAYAVTVLVYVEPRPKGLSWSNRRLCRQDHAHHALGTFKTQRGAIDWAKSKGQRRLLHESGTSMTRKKPDDWRAP